VRINLQTIIFQIFNTYFKKANPRLELASEETKRLNKLEAIAEKIKRVENVQNLQLQTWLIEDE